MFQSAGSRGALSYQQSRVDALLSGYMPLTQTSNMFWNPAMDVDQVNVGAARTGVGATNISLIDGVAYFQQGPPSARVTAQQVSDAPPGYLKSLKLTVTTAEASMTAGHWVGLDAGIEGYVMQRLGWGTSNALPIVIGFWVKVNRPGPYSFAVGNNAGNRQYIVGYTVYTANVWEYKTVIIPGDVTGTWTGTMNLGMIYVYWTVASGTTLQTTTPNTWITAFDLATQVGVNGVAATSDTFQITGIMAHPGNIVVPQTRAPYLMPRFQDALTWSQRYYEKSYDYETTPGTVTANGKNKNQWQLTTAQTAAFYDIYQAFRVVKRAAPTITGYSPVTGASGKFRDEVSNADITLATDAIGATGFSVFGTCGATSTATPSLSFHWQADAGL